MGYDPSKNQAKGAVAFAAASAVVASYQGMVETAQWAAGLAGVQLPPMVAQFLCGALVSAVAYIGKRMQNWRKHAWKR